MSKLIIIESPSKAPAIMSYLGKEYKVMASKGHVRDLPKSSLGVNIDDGFSPKYIVIKGKNDLINDLKKEAKSAEAVYFATDPDREGEAISWHLATVLGIDPKDCLRVAFNEITKTAIISEIKKPRPIDMNLVDAQQARRVLDRIVGYQLSPYLWKTIKSGLSAGRVQSVAARLIVERDVEIDAFVPKEYWTVEAELKWSGRSKISAKFYGNENGKVELSSKEEADAVISACKDKKFTAASVTKAKKAKSPLPPFETATLQQDASRRLGFPSKKIMRVAQELYEGVDLGQSLGGTHGVITYMRTDSLRISDEASAAAKNFILGKYGRDYYPAKPRFFKSSGAQDAHEAIRPTNVELTPDMLKGKLSNDQYKLYKLIWERFVASQMKNAEISTISAVFDCGGYEFRSSESTVLFNGYMLVYDDTEVGSENDGKLSKLSDGDVLTCENIVGNQNFTEPPARYTEGSLVKILKEKGIGRPSTYAQTITTIIDRGYVTLEKKAFKSTPLGKATVEIMKKNFPKIVDYRFTADVETSLDKIAEGEESFTEVLTDFYGDFEKTLGEAQKHLKENRVKIPDEESDIVCEKCGRKMVIKTGRYGKFAACPGYPECKNTKRLDVSGKKVVETQKQEPEKTDLVCEKCGSPLVIRSSRYGKFYACTAYPKCKYTKAIREEIGVPCPKCGAPIVKNHGKKNVVFYSCSRYPDCDFSAWDRPTDKKCPECGSMLALKESKNMLVCTNKECKHTEENK